MDSQEINQILNTYSWIKVDQYKQAPAGNPNVDWKYEYERLAKHHIAETEFLISKVRELARLINAQAIIDKPMEDVIKIGDEVTCVNDKPLTGKLVGPPLTAGNKVNIKNIVKCGCGKDHYDVGLISEYNYISCFDCGEELPDGDSIHWCHPSRFTK